MPEPDFRPTLTGPTVIVRPVVPADWQEMFAAGSDPAIWEVHPIPDRYTEPAFRKFFDGAAESKMGFFGATYLLTDDHALEAKVLEAFPTLKAISRDRPGLLMKHVVSTVLRDQPMFFVDELKRLFLKILDGESH
jgi:hypothetical protein